jgi:hypothetical protein
MGSLWASLSTALTGSLGVVPVAEVPVLVLVLGLAGLVVAGNLLASVPAAIAARTRAGLFLRAEYRASAPGGHGPA